MRTRRPRKGTWLSQGHSQLVAKLWVMPRSADSLGSFEPHFVGTFGGLNGADEGKVLAWAVCVWQILLVLSVDSDLGQVSSCFPSILDWASCGSPLWGGHTERVGQAFWFHRPLALGTVSFFVSTAPQVLYHLLGWRRRLWSGNLDAQSQLKELDLAGWKLSIGCRELHPETPCPGFNFFPLLPACMSTPLSRGKDTGRQR